MYKILRERLTYRLATTMLGATITLLIGVYWFNNPDLKHPEPMLVVLAAGSVILSGLATLFLPRLVSDQLIFTNAGEKPLSEDTRRKNREDMLTLVEDIWIKGFLDNVLNQMRSLNIDLRFSEPGKVLQRPGMESYTLPDNEDILRVYNELKRERKRRMVILGQPGAGKTVLMLQLARGLIAEARADVSKPIPVVLALSSWAANPRPLEDWLRDELREKYGQSPKVVDDLVLGEQLLYLLDGLDEVAEELRESCLQEIKIYVESGRDVDYVLCSRAKEFKKLTTRLDVIGEIVLQPLTERQIYGYLSSEEFESLRKVMEQNDFVQGFAQVPFMLNTMAVVTRGMGTVELMRDIGAYTEVEPLRDYFLEAYINRRLKEKLVERFKDVEQTRRWLKWLAVQLVLHNQTDFYIESLQPGWLDNDQLRKAYSRQIRLALGLTFGLALGLAGGRAGGLGLALGLAVGLVVGLVVGLAVGQIHTYRPIADYLVWRFNERDRAFGRAFGFGTQQPVQLRLTPGANIPRSALRGLTVTLAFGLAGGLALGLALGLTNGLDTFIQHAVLRRLLARGGHLPFWRYDHFLDYAAELVILRKVGGGYRFVHDYLRQYLASATFVADPTVGTE